MTANGRELAPDYPWRWKRAIDLATNAGFDGLYVTAGPNFRWLSGLSPYIGGWPVWLSCVVISRDGGSAIVVSEMHSKIFDWSSSPIKGVFTYRDGADPATALRSAFAAAGLTSRSRIGVTDEVGFADVELLRTTFPEIAIERSNPSLDSCRAVKDSYELDLLRTSGKAVDAIYATAAEVIRAGIPQQEVGLALIRSSLENSSERPIVGGTFRRYDHGDFAVGDVVDVDTGAWFSGYSVDTARTVFVGEPKRELLDLYSVVIAAYQAAVAEVRPGIPANRVHEACAGVIAASGQQQVWKVGHGVGLSDGHEHPLLQADNDQPLEENMVFTIDPGFFIGRDLPLHIEDTVVVTADGCEPLNRFTLDPVVV